MWLLATILVIIIGVGVFHRYKPVHYPLPRTVPVPPEAITFHADDLLSELCRSFSRANCIVIDIFMFNEHGRTTGKVKRILNAINPQARQYYLLDPLNTLYGTIPCPTIDALKGEVFMLDIDRLPDTNMLYSPWWRGCIQPFGTRGKGHLRTGFATEKTTLRAALKAFNLKANHRKVVVCDDVTYVMSMNLDTKSDGFSNSGVGIRSAEVANIAISHTQHLVTLSGYEKTLPRASGPSEEGTEKVTLLTGPHIKEALLEDIDRAKRRIRIAMLFLSERKVISRLHAAARRGVAIDFFLDNNTETFNRDKSGMPNRIVAPELSRSGRVFMYKHKCSELHDKLVLIDDSILHCGSANLTRKSLLGTNPETMARILFSGSHPVVTQVNTYLDSLDCEENAGRLSPFRYVLYWLMERSGCSTF